MILYRVIDWKVQGQDFSRGVVLLQNERGDRAEVPVKTISVPIIVGQFFVSFEPYEAAPTETVETTDA